MRYLSINAFETDRTSDDEIDQLFSHLEQFEPPVDFVDRVMAEVLRLPLPQFRSPWGIDGGEHLIQHSNVRQ